MSGTIAKNKIFAGYMALAFWGAFLAIGLSAGKPLWNRKGLSLLSMFLALGGGVLSIVFTASIGGTLAGKPSGFEEVARVFIETRETLVLPLGLNILLIVIAVVIPVLV